MYQLQMILVLILTMLLLTLRKEHIFVLVYIEARQYSKVGERNTLMIKTVSFDKLAGTDLGKYHLERLLGQSKIGPTFLIRDDANSSHLLRFLNVSTNRAPRDHSDYLEHFQYRASQIVTLQHPYLLPLVDYGVFRGMPYLVSPHLPLRSLRTRLSKTGVLDTYTVGRYVDQMATALEYAHEHAVVHGSLSVDSIFIRLDGNLMIADMGVRSLLELTRQTMSGNQFLEWSEGYAPEQLLGKPSSPATDVYAMGVVAYHLLTGSAVFEANTIDERVQRHLYASVPPLTEWRSDLPSGLSSILAHALAKDPTQRFHQPGAFANAYHGAMGATNRARLPFVVSSLPNGQTNYPYANGASAADIQQYTERTWSNNRTSAGDHAPVTPPSIPQPPSIPHSLHGFSDDVPLGLTNYSRRDLTSSPRPTLLHRLGRKNRRRNILIAGLLVLLVVGGSLLGFATLSQRSSALTSAGGQVMFFGDQNSAAGQTNSLHITVQHLSNLSAGSNYAAWIINDQTEAVLGLGKLIKNGQTWSLTYNGANSNLLEAGDKLEITQEQGGGVGTVPSGPVILVGAFPVMAFQHIQHLLVSFPETPGKVGMLMGLLQQTRLLDNQAAVLQSVATNQDTVAIGCVTQSMLDIIEGTKGAHYHPLLAVCAGRNVTATGDGFGLLDKGFIADAEEHASLALSQKDATNVMRQHAALMDIALSNITGWMTTIDKDLLHQQAHLTDMSSLQQISLLADDAYHGVDVNGDGQIDPVVGEAGAITAYQQGQFMATVTLVPST